LILEINKIIVEILKITLTYNSKENKIQNL